MSARETYEDLEIKGERWVPISEVSSLRRYAKANGLRLTVGDGKRRKRSRYDSRPTHIQAALTKDGIHIWRKN